MSSISPYSQPVTTQPMVGFVGQQPQKTEKRAWTYGLCDCCGECGSCLCAWLFPWCFKYSLSEKMGEGCCTCFCAGLAAMRTKTRVERGIEVGCFKNKFFFSEPFLVECYTRVTRT